ncbi:CPL12 [Auxenochlorella protothecoides x Auxenochlorella symbiontica]
MQCAVHRAGSSFLSETRVTGSAHNHSTLIWPDATRARQHACPTTCRMFARTSRPMKPSTSTKAITSTAPREFKSQSGSPASPPDDSIRFHGVHHVGLLCSSLSRSLDFYCGVLGLAINPDRPDAKLPYAGAWLWIGPEMIHLMELQNPNPNPTPDGVGDGMTRDRHTCVGVHTVKPLEERLEAHGIPFQRSANRPAIFFKDPDNNCLEVVEIRPWRQGQ